MTVPHNIIDRAYDRVHIESNTLQITWLFCDLENIVLTHLPLVPHICVSESGQYWFRLWLVAFSTLLSIRPLRTNFSEICIKRLSIHKNALENAICETAAILSRGRWVNSCSIFPSTYSPNLCNIPESTHPLVNINLTLIWHFCTKMMSKIADQRSSAICDILSLCE